MNNIALTQRAQISSGELIQEAIGYTCDAYDIIDVTVAGLAADMEVELYGAGSECSLLAILIPNGVYPATVPGTPDVSYKIADAGHGVIPLGNMHLFSGRGAIEALIDGAAEPTKLYFSNINVSAVVVKVLVGRDATP